jgi:hypothetical protein
MTPKTTLAILSRWFAPTRRPVAARRPRRMAIEVLEDRCVPATFNVTSLVDSVTPVNGQLTLRAAIQAANNTADPNGNTINLTVPGTYQITLAPTTANQVDNQAGEFAISGTNNNNSNLTIVNTSGGKVAIDGNQLARVFDIEPNFNFGGSIPAAKLFTVTLGGTGAGQGFTIQNGRAFDATGNNADGAAAVGGGVRDVGPVSLTLNNLIVTNNSATADGGGVGLENSVSTPWTLTLNNSTIAGNSAGDAGGGIDVDGSGKVFINNSTIDGNTSVNQGGGIWLDAVEVNNVFQTANLTVTGSLISNNTSITNNPAENDGGGIGNAGNGVVTIANSTLSHNYTGGVGGGFGDANGQGTLIVQNSTFVDNVAAGNGGGIEASGPTTTISDTTIAGNITLAQGGGLAVTSASFTLNNTIVALDQVNNANGANFQGTAPDVIGTVTTGSNNFIGIGDANLVGISNGTNGNHVGTLANPLNPDLGPVQNNGGPTPTRAPLLGSPVIDAGLNTVIAGGTVTDQRGFLRIVNNTVDIGAVEFQPPATTTQLNVTPNPATFGQPVTFTATVTAQTNGSNPPTGTVTFSIDGVAQAPAPLTNGMATLTVTTLPTGMHAVTATYSGDVNFTTSTATVNETVQGLQDVSRLVTVTRVKHGKKGKGSPLMQTLKVMNTSGTAIQGPIYLVLDGLTNNVKLVNATGVSQTHVTPGDPFKLLTMGPLGAGQSMMVNLMFTARNPNKVMAVNFNTFVLAGPGTV